MWGCKDNFVPGSLRKVKSRVQGITGDCSESHLIGDVHLSFPSKKGPITSLLKDVIYNPKLVYNLLSVSRLTRDGITVIFPRYEQPCQFILPNSSTPVAVAPCIGGLYRIKHINYITDFANLAVPSNYNLLTNLEKPPQLLSKLNTPLPVNITTQAELDALHRRFCHYSKTYLSKFVNIDPKLKLSPCVACIRGRAVKEKLGMKMPVPKCCFDHVTSDLCGPFPVRSMSHNHYFAVVIDTRSRFCWVFFLNRKSDFADKFMKWHARICTKYDVVVKWFHTDGGGEFVNADMKQFCEKNGMNFTASSAHNSDQNSIAERKIRALQEIARAMMIEADAPRYLWEEAVRYAVFVTNRMPHKALDMKTPMQVLYNACNVDADDFELLKMCRTWGCTFYEYIYEGDRRKGDDRTVPRMFVGIDEFKKGFRIYDLTTRTISVRTRGFFLEDSFPCKKRSVVRDDVECDTLFSLFPLYCDCKVENHVQPTSNVDLVGNVSPVTHAHANNDDMKHTNFDDEKKSDFEIASETKSNQVNDVVAVNDIDVDAGPANMLRRSQRGWNPTKLGLESLANFAHVAMLACSSALDIAVPDSHREVLVSPQKLKWLDAERTELNALEENETWEEVARTNDMHVIGCRWTYDLKLKPDMTIDRYKARLVARGDQQKHGVDYTETFASVARIASFRLILVLAVFYGLTLHYLDVGNAFVNAKLKERIFINYPPGYKRKEGFVLRLRKALYGLKQAGREWAELLRATLCKMNFKPTLSDPCVYYHPDPVCYVCTWVDDIPIATADDNFRSYFISELTAVFKIKFDPLVQYLGQVITTTSDSIYVSQEKYVYAVLNRYGMEDCKPSTTPGTQNDKHLYQQPPYSDVEAARVPYRSLVGALLWLALCTRPDILFQVIFLSKFNTCFGPAHWQALKKVLRYVKGTAAYRLVFRPIKEWKLVAYVDSDWATDEKTRRSVTGFVILLAGCVVAYRSRSQRNRAMSSVEAEFLALSELAKELQWWYSMLSELGVAITDPAIVWCDNTGAISLFKNKGHHERTKHVDLWYKFVRDEMGDLVKVQHIRTDENISDVLTKTVKPQVLRALVPQLLDTNSEPTLSAFRKDSSK
jgi:histone deacetylase 1/2